MCPFQHELTFSFIRELIETAPSNTSARTLYKVALTVCERLADGNSTLTDNNNKGMNHVTQATHRLLCQAATHCSEGKEAQDVGISLPSPCTATSQAFLVSAFQWRIQDDKNPSDHVTRNALAARNNETWGLGKKTSETLKDQLKKICKYYCDILESSREVIVIYKELREDEINVVNKRQTWQLGLGNCVVNCDWAIGSNKRKRGVWM